MIETKKETIIISPHHDDDVIGNYEILMDKSISPIVIYMQENEERKQEALQLKKCLDNIKIQLFQKNMTKKIK